MNVLSCECIFVLENFMYNIIDLVHLTTRSLCTGVGLVVFQSSLGLWFVFVSGLAETIL